MSRIRLLLAVSFVVMLGFYGCSKPDTSEPTPSTPDVSSKADTEDQSEQSSHTSKTEAEKIAEGLAKLSEEDRASVEKQKTCPITGEMLGEEGEPVKVAVNDLEVWVCCEGCKNDLLANPEKYLAKMNQ